MAPLTAIISNKMSLSSHDILKVSKHIRLHKIDNSNFIGWNKFFPTLFILNKDTLRLLEILRNKKNINRVRLNKQLEILHKYKFIFQGKSDPFERLFFKSVDDLINKADQNVAEFYREKRDYSQLYLMNDGCNLNCSYCIKKYKTNNNLLSNQRQNRIDEIFNVTDQYISRKIIRKISPINISFNGGEFLLEWGLIKNVINRITEKYKNSQFQYFINTNMTLMTDEIAKFMSKHKFIVHLSIDGYKELHDKTRKYHNGKGSFDDVINGLNIFRSHNKENKIFGYQGTIEYPDSFRIADVYEMSKYGFRECRLAPNLLNVSKNDAFKKAKLFSKLFESNAHKKFKVTESYFSNMQNLINLDEYKFFFNCVGLCPLPNMGISLNVSRMHLSQLCGFVNKAEVPIEEIGNDIYNPKLWEVSRAYIYSRIESLRRNCTECDLIGICKGGCILTGLDIDNKVNKSACVFQREMWKRFLDIIFKYKKQKNI